MNTELSPPPPAGATHRPKGLRSTRWLAASIVALLLGRLGWQWLPRVSAVSNKGSGRQSLATLPRMNRSPGEIPWWLQVPAYSRCWA